MPNDDEVIVESLFHGKLQNRICCDSCNYQSTRDETFVDLPVPLNKPEEQCTADESKLKTEMELKMEMEHATGETAFCVYKAVQF